MTMTISLNTRFATADGDLDIWNANGFGSATWNVWNSLKSLGYDIRCNNPEANVEIAFEQPWHVKWTNESQYHVSFVPWESTRIPADWRPLFNECDEVWTPSPLIAEWFANDGVTTPIYVYEHGVDHNAWTPTKRTYDGGTFRFLHMNAEAVRKQAALVMRARRMAFPTEDVELHMKAIFGAQQPPWPWFPKIHMHNKQMDLPELLDLMHSCHALAFFSYGEGFGLPPLEALATGMPVIAPVDILPYRRFIMPELSISARLQDSPHPQVHPGMVMVPDFAELVEKMRWLVNNYDEAVDWHMANVAKIKEEYDWINLTRDAFTALEERLKER